MHLASHTWHISRAFALILCSSTPAVAQSPVHLWSDRYGGTSADEARAVAIAPNGDVIFAGSFSGTVDLGGGALTSAGATDIFLARHTSGGTHLWSKKFGSSGSEFAFSAAVDASGNILLTGYFNGTASFGGASLVSSSWDVFVARYNPDGGHIWSQRFGDTNIDRGNSIAVDVSGNVFVTGYFNGTVNFGGSPLVSAGSNDAFLVKFDSGGVHQWSRRFGNANPDIGNSVAVDGSGNVLAAGSFYGTVDFGGGDLVSAGNNDIFLAKYDADGIHQWSQRLGSAGSDQGNAVATDASGNVIVTGSFADTVDFGGGGLASAGARDVFVAKYDGGGAHQWSRRGGGTGNDEGAAICVDAADRVTVTGWFRYTADFGGDSLVAPGVTENVLLVAYDGAGTQLWSRGAGDTGSDIGYAIATDNAGSVFTAGAFSGTIDLGGGGFTSAGNLDIYFAKYAHTPEPAISSIVDVPNDQGLRVRITFVASGLDAAESATPIARYDAYRRDDPPPAAPAAMRDAAALSERELLDAGWTPLGYVHAHGFAEYSIDAPTVADSTIENGMFHSVFFIRAVTLDTLTFFDSPPDSGYSLDNLEPGVPVNVVFASGVLSWSKPAAPDVDHFTVYGAVVDAFDAATVLRRTASTTMDVSASPFAYYFVTATDDAGNESAPAGVTTLTGANGPAPPPALAVSNFPNPFNPRTAVRYTVPARGPVTVGVYDVRGARVATLVDRAPHEAGTYTIEWSGRSDGGRSVASGVYLLRIEHHGSTRSSKIVVLK